MRTLSLTLTEQKNHSVSGTEQQNWYCGENQRPTEFQFSMGRIASDSCVMITTQWLYHFHCEKEAPSA